MEHKDFDQFFQKKLNHQEFEFQDDFWKEMEAQLPAPTASPTLLQRAKAKLLGLGVACLTLGIVAGGVFVFYKMAFAKTVAEVATDTASTPQQPLFDEVAQPSASFRPKTDENSRPATTATTERSNQIKQPQPAENAKNTARNAQQPTTAPQTDEQPATYSPRTQSENTASSPTAENRRSNAAPNSDVSTEQRLPQGEKNIAENNTNSSNNNNGNNTENNNSNYNNTNTPTFAKANNTAQYAENTTAIPNKNSIESGTEQLPNSEPQAVPALAANLLLRKNLDKITPNTAAELPKNAPTAPTTRHLAFSLTAGAYMVRGFQNSETARAAYTLSPTAGVQATFQPSRFSAWRVRAAGLYNVRSGLNSIYRYEVVQYGFGATTLSQSIAIGTLHSVQLPILAGYARGRHYFWAGLNVGYALNAKSETSGSITEITSSEVLKTAQATTETWGYVDAFNRFDFGATVGYDYTLNNGTQLGLRLNYGFADVTKNEIFNNTQHDNTLGLGFFITVPRL